MKTACTLLVVGTLVFLAACIMDQIIHIVKDLLKENN